MTTVVFTGNLKRHIDAPPRQVRGQTVREALDAVFEEHRDLRGYVLDDQGQLRKHVVVFLNGRMIEDRATLSDAVGEDAELYVMQALSGG